MFEKIEKLCLLSVIFVSFVGFGCKSTKNDDTRTQILYEVDNENGEVSPVIETEDETKELSQEEVQEVVILTEEVPPEENTPEESNFTGWVDTSNKPIDYSLGKIRFKVKPKKGTFNILVLNEDERSIPVLSTSNEYMTTSFYLLAGKKIYKLNEDSNVKTFARRIENGVSLRYFIENVSEVVVNFECLKSSETSDYDTIKVSSTVTNLKKTKNNFALKVIFDTVLGETDRHHFYNSNKEPVRNELSLRNFKYEKWFVSQNSSASLQFLFEGSDITPPSLVALANYSTLANKKSWEPDMSTYKTFDTVLSYNNSAVGVYWEKQPLAVEENFTSIFYMAVASDNHQPSGDLLINDSSIGNNDVEIITTDKEPEKKAVEEPVKEFITPDSQPKTPENNSPIEVIDQPVIVEEKNIDSDIQNKKKTNEKEDNFEEKYTEEYVRRLLIRIAELETSNAEINKSELDMLNAELDSILEYLRK